MNSSMTMSDDGSRKPWTVKSRNSPAVETGMIIANKANTKGDSTGVVRGKDCPEERSSILQWVDDHHHQQGGRQDTSMGK